MLEDAGHRRPPTLSLAGRELRELSGAVPVPHRGPVFQAGAGRGDPLLLSLCAPFRIWRSQRRLTLADVRRRAEGNGLYAVDRGDSCRPLSAAGKGTCCCLTAQQKDFLINHLGLPIIVLNAQQKLKFRPQRIRVLFRSANRGWQKIAGRAGARGHRQRPFERRGATPVPRTGNALATAAVGPVQRPTARTLSVRHG